MLGLPGSRGRADRRRAPRCSNPVTVATAIRIGNPASWRLAETARDESGGLIDAVTDDQILAAYRLLAREEGVFGEPASAAGVAGLLQACERGQVAAGSVVVCTITGNGLKDPATAIAGCPEPAVVAGRCRRRRGRPGPAADGAGLRPG